MHDRLELHEILCELLGSRNVYFQPPEGLKLKYPAIVYTLSNIKNDYSNNIVYLQKNRYSLTVIDKNPDSPIVKTVSKFPYCSYDRHFCSDNLNHDVFTIYF